MLILSSLLLSLLILQPVHQPPNWDLEVLAPLRAIQRAEEAQAVLPTVIVPKVAPAPFKPLKIATAHSDIVAIITHWAGVYGVSADWMVRVAQCESRFNVNAHNPSGATGLFQFMPGTFYGHGGKDIYDANDQSRVAAQMFAAGQSGQWVCR